MPKSVRVAEVTELEPGEGKTVEIEGVSLVGNDVFVELE